MEILRKMDESSIPLDLQSVITMLKAQGSAGSPQSSTSATMQCQLMPYLQQETLSELPRPGTEEFSFSKVDGDMRKTTKNSS